MSILKLRPFCLFSIVCVRIVCMGEGHDLHVCVWGPKVDVRNYPFSSTLFTEAESCSQTLSSHIWLVLLASLLWGLRVSAFWGGLEWESGCHADQMFMWVVGIWTLVLSFMRYFNHEAISPAQSWTFLECEYQWDHWLSVLRCLAYFV